MPINNMQDLCPRWRDMLHATCVTHPYIDGSSCILSYGGLKGPRTASDGTLSGGRLYVPENTVEFTLELWVRPALVERTMEVLRQRTSHIRGWFLERGYQPRTFRARRRPRGPLSSGVDLFVFQATVPKDRADQLKSDVEAFLAE